MTVTANFRGHECWYDESANAWRYSDNDTICDDNRPCLQCNQLPTPEGYDACIGHVPGAISACCGHGVEDGYVVWKPKEAGELEWSFRILGVRFSVGWSVTPEMVDSNDIEDDWVRGYSDAKTQTEPQTRL